MQRTRPGIEPAMLFRIDPRVFRFRPCCFVVELALETRISHFPERLVELMKLIE